MSKPIILRNLGVLTVVAALACAAVFAGGPLYLHDPATKTPYAWPDGYAPVFTDLGLLGQLTNARADTMVQFSVDQWNAVPTSSFSGAIEGDFTAIGLPDITASNLDLVIGTYNGGGVHVVYDADGSIITSIFGSPYGVLGVTIIEYVSDASPAILEATIILNGFSVPEPPTDEDLAAQQFAGISTHELGHAINLAHTQTNGQIFFFFDPWTGPTGCATPYAGYPSSDDFETMYPLVNLYQTAIAQSTVDILDDTAAVSDLYPAAGWPNSYASITGTIYEPERANSQQRRQVTGANVIARNVANPWRDAISGVSGGLTQGLAGPDGTYAFHGLTPGANYVVYDEAILVGAFSTPHSTVLPGPEEYWNGAQESGNGKTDARCAWTTIAPVAGSPTIADVTFNKVKGAPVFTPIELPTSTITELSGDGQAAVGAWDGGIFRWTPAGVDLLEGADWRSPQAGISRDGQKIAASVADENGIQTAALWQAGQGWMSLGALPGSTSCDISLSSGWGVSDNGTVVGLNWLDCSSVTAFKWQSGTGMASLGFLGPPDNLGGSRANRISADGTTVVGWDRATDGFWRGAMWRDGQESLVSQPPVLCCDFDPSVCTIDTVGVANGVTPDGSIIVGENYAVQQVYVDPDTGDEFHYCTDGAWKWTPAGGTEYLGDFLPGYSPKAFDVSDDGSVIVGVAFPPDFFSPRRPLLWTETTGFMDFQEFLERQGTFAPEWSLAIVGTVSGDGKTVGGYAFSPYAIQGFVVQMDKVVICHAPPGNPANKRSIDISFPGGLASHLAHGDTIGMCGNGI